MYVALIIALTAVPTQLRQTLNFAALTLRNNRHVLEYNLYSFSEEPRAQKSGEVGKGSHWVTQEMLDSQSAAHTE